MTDAHRRSIGGRDSQQLREVQYVDHKDDGSGDAALLQEQHGDSDNDNDNDNDDGGETAALLSAPAPRHQRLGPQEPQQAAVSVLDEGGRLSTDGSGTGLTHRDNNAAVAASAAGVDATSTSGSGSGSGAAVAVSMYDYEDDDKDKRPARDCGLAGMQRKHPTATAVAAVFVSGILLRLSTDLYARSLAGGDLFFVQRHLKTLAASLIMSAVFFFFSIVVLVVAIKPNTRGRALARIVCIVINCVVTFFSLSQDMGADFGKHGEYNMIGFVATVLPLTCACIALLLICPLVVLVSRASWNSGIHGLSMDSGVPPPACTVIRPEYSAPWVQLAPHRAFNFWAGSLECPDIEQFTSFKDGKLYVECPTTATLTSPANVYDTRQGSFPDDVKDAIQKMYERSVVSPVKPGQPITISEEFVQVDCGTARNYELHHIPKPELLKPADTDDPQTQPVNVLMMVFDAASRAAMHRKMSKTLAKLEKLSEQGGIKVYEFFRYNAVGVNTGPNSGALFTGVRSPANAMDQKSSSEVSVDVELERSPPIWHKFKQRGYATMMAHGLCQDWSRVYRHTPAISIDHNLYEPFCHADAFPYPTPYSNFAGPFSWAGRCLHGRYVHEYVLDYSKEFLQHYPHRGRFGVSIFMEGHEGTGEVLHTVDDDLSDFFEDLALPHNGQSPLLQNTIIVLTADHGLHMGLYAAFTEYGKLEWMLPGLFVIAPTGWLETRKDIQAALEFNQHSLVTPHDVHDGLEFLTSLQEFGAGRAAQPSATRGIFGTIPRDRTCEQANISPNHCTCSSVPEPE